MSSRVVLPLVGGWTITLRAKHMLWTLVAQLWLPSSWRSRLVTAWLPTAVLGTLHMLLGDSSSKLSIEITYWFNLCAAKSGPKPPKLWSKKWMPKMMWSLPVCKSLQCVAANILDTRSMAAVKVHYSWKLFLSEESHSGQTTCYASCTLVPSKLHRQTQGWTCHLSVAHALHFGWSTR